MTSSILSSAVSIEGTRVMQGASRGLDQSTLLALVSFSDFSAPQAPPLLAALDAGLCNRRPSMTAQWAQFRAGRLSGWARPGPVEAQGIADAILWLWMSLQREHGNPSSEGVLQPIGSDRFELAVPYLDPDLAHVTLRHAVEYVNRAAAVAAGESDIASQDALRGFFETAGKRITSPLVNAYTRRFLRVASRRGVPWNRLTHDVYQLGWGSKARRVTGTHTDRTPLLAQQIAKNKAATRYLLSRAGFPTVRYGWAQTEDLCLSLAERIGYPVVVKPVEQDGGTGVATRLTCSDEVGRAYRTASQYGPVLVEEHVEGNDYRLLVVGGSVAAVAHRVPGGVTGDGRNTVRALVDEVNADPRRGMDKEGLMRLDLDAEADEVLRKQGLTADAIPEPGRFVALREAANVSRGGTPVDVTRSVHPDNRLLVERACRVVGLDLAGIDLLIPDITRSWREVGGVIVEVNSAPDLNVHWLADPERDICAEVLDWMLDGGTGRIPVAAVAGGKGQDRVSRLLHAILCSAGIHAGAATTRGVWIGDAFETDRDLSGSLARDALLTDPSVEAAVIEISTAGLMSQGHPCDRYAVAALLNVSGDADGGYTAEVSAQVLGEVLARATEAVVVNADDALCLEMLKEAAPKRRVLVSRSAGGAGVQAHLAGGGEAVFVEEDAGRQMVVVGSGGSRQVIMPLADLTGAAPGGDELQVQHCLIAAALAHTMEIDAANIRQGLTAATVGDPAG